MCDMRDVFVSLVTGKQTPACIVDCIIDRWPGTCCDTAWDVPWLWVPYLLPMRASYLDLITHVVVYTGLHSPLPPLGMGMRDFGQVNFNLQVESRLPTNLIRVQTDNVVCRIPVVPSGWVATLPCLAYNLCCLFSCSGGHRDPSMMHDSELAGPSQARKENFRAGKQSRPCEERKKNSGSGGEGEGRTLEVKSRKHHPPPPPPILRDTKKTRVGITIFIVHSTS